MTRRPDPHAHEAVLTCHDHGSPGVGRRASFAERKERRAAVDDPAVVLEAAARFLEPRARSVVEVRRRLTGAGYQTDLVEGAITRMLELGMLDDEAFARAWVESRDRARPRGERAIRQELGLKGVDRPTIDLVLGERREAAAGIPSDDGEMAITPGPGRRGTSAGTQRPEPGARRRPPPAAPARLRVARPQRVRPGHLPDDCRDSLTVPESVGCRKRVQRRMMGTARCQTTRCVPRDWRQQMMVRSGGSARSAPR